MRGRRLLILVLLALAGAAPVRAQVRVDRPTGELSVEFDGSRLDFPSRSGDRIRTLREWLLFRTAVTVVHPSIARLDVALRPLLAQTYWTGPVESPSGGVEQLNGKLGLSLLSAQPLSAYVSVFRVNANNRGRFGSRIDTDIAEWAARSDLRFWAIPSKLEYIDNRRDALHLQPSGSSFRQDQRVRTLRFQARNSKTGVTLERLNFDDHIGAASYDHTRGQFDHRFQWGKGSRLNSLFQYLDRVGVGSVERISWRQSLLVQHTWKLHSEGFYALHDQRTRTDFSRGWSAQFIPVYKVSERVRFAVEGWGQARQFDLGFQSYYRLKPRASLTAALPAGMFLRADVGAGYEWHQQDTSESGTSTVVDERHTIDESGSFTLDELLVIPATVVLRSPDGVLIYEEGFDYRLVPAGPLLEVVTLPGGRLDAGMVVLADYQFEILLGGAANSVATDWNVGLSVGPATLYYRGQRQDEVGGSQDGVTAIPTLRDFNDERAGVRLSTNTPAGNLNLIGEWGHSSARTYEFTSYLVSGALGFPIGRRFTGTASGRYTARHGGEFPYDLLQGDMTLTWFPLPGLRVLGRVGAYDWSEGPLRGEHYIGGGLGAEWQINLTMLAVRYDYLNYREGFLHTENRLLVRVSRAF